MSVAQDTKGIMILQKWTKKLGLIYFLKKQKNHVSWLLIEFWELCELSFNGSYLYLRN